MIRYSEGVFWLSVTDEFPHDPLTYLGCRIRPLLALVGWTEPHACLLLLGCSGGNLGLILTGLGVRCARCVLSLLRGVLFPSWTPWCPIRASNPCRFLWLTFLLFIVWQTGDGSGGLLVWLRLRLKDLASGCLMRYRGALGMDKLWKWLKMAFLDWRGCGSAMCRETFRETIRCRRACYLFVLVGFLLGITYRIENGRIC